MTTIDELLSEWRTELKAKTWMFVRGLRNRKKGLAQKKIEIYHEYKIGW